MIIFPAVARMAVAVCPRDVGSGGAKAASGIPEPEVV